MQSDKRSSKTPTPLQNSTDKSVKGRRIYGIFGVIAIAALCWTGVLKFALPLIFENSSASAGTETTIPKSATPQIAEATQAVEPGYRAYELPQATVHVVTLPAGTRISMAVAEDLATVKDFAQQENAVAVLNGGFFDPQNGKTTSHLILQGNTLEGPAENERLMGNPALQPYLDKILNRSEFRAYQCRTSDQTSEMRYFINSHDESDMPFTQSCVLVNAIGAGPQLLPEDTSFEEGFTDYANGELVRDAIGGMGPNARSAIALTPNNDILLIMVAQRSDSTGIALGLTLPEVAEFATSLGASELLNLDGGSSSSLYYDGQIYLGRLDASGDPIERPVKSAIAVEP